MDLFSNFIESCVSAHVLHRLVVVLILDIEYEIDKVEGCDSIVVVEYSSVQLSKTKNKSRRKKKLNK